MLVIGNDKTKNEVQPPVRRVRVRNKRRNPRILLRLLHQKAAALPSPLHQVRRRRDPLETQPFTTWMVLSPTPKKSIVASSDFVAIVVKKVISGKPALLGLNILIARTRLQIMRRVLRQRV